MTERDIEITVHASLHDIDAREWDVCADAAGGAPADPFTTYRFLRALEDSGSVGEGTGWYPRYLVARQGGQIVACAPLYAKTHSQGEYIFDHSWAHAFERAGGQYYPKLQVAVPFTPATGRRFLTRPGHEAAGMSALVQGAVQLAAQNGYSSLHATFCTEAEALAGAQMGLMHRVTQQFHWQNAGYGNFDDFLGALSSRKRKAIRRERRIAAQSGLEIRELNGAQIDPQHWDHFWRFYQDTGGRKWGTPYLTRAFFDHVDEFMRDDCLLVLAFDGDTPVAGALNFIGRDALYGRYWGCTQHHPCLHFELCYYRAIEYAITHGLSRVEAGAQGEHKLARGYLPSETHSLHWVADPEFARAIGAYLDAERAAVGEEVELLTSFGPFKSTHVEEQE
ncbi:GNAT family N-acetyltransferase [Aliiroseovarius sp. PTFE2010]|uniref:GNAT family N-acetyltransferase n=1 Tax=Aliiroseovarius sp. PTFE2010 TaxID=3417190 RepID=UPI003CF8669F